MIWSDRIGDCQLSVERVVRGYRARVVYCGALVYSDTHDTITVARLSCERVALSWLCHVTALGVERRYNGKEKPRHLVGAGACLSRGRAVMRRRDRL
jgi:hypothetical protein